MRWRKSLKVTNFEKSSNLKTFKESKKERRREGRFFYALLPILPDFYFQPEKRHFFTIMRFRQNRIICRISISRLQIGKFLQYFNLLKYYGKCRIFIPVLWAVAFLLLLVLNTTHINKNNKKGHYTITKGRAYSNVRIQNQIVSHQPKCPALLRSLNAHLVNYYKNKEPKDQTTTPTNYTSSGQI